MKTPSPYVIPGLPVDLPDMSLDKDALHVIFKIVEDVTGVSQKSMKEKGRKEEGLFARYFYIKAARSNTKCTNRQIVALIDRDRSTVYNSIEQFNNLLETDDGTKEKYKRIKEQLYRIYNS